MNLLTYKTLEELNQDLADYIIKVAEMSIEENDRFDFVLTGGSSPKALYHYLATECQPVSYTHLDVYKRQQLHYTTCIQKVICQRNLL